VRADQEINNFLKDLGDDKEVQALGIEDVVAESLAFFKKLNSLAESVDTWKQKDDIKRKRADAESLMREFDEKFAAVLDFHACLESLMKDRKLVKRKEKRHDRYVASKQVAVFTNGGHPLNVAKFLGAFDMGRAIPTAQVACANAEYDPYFKSSRSYKKPTCSIFDPNGAASSDEIWHYFSKLVGENKELLEKTLNRGITAIKKDAGEDKSAPKLARALCSVDLLAVDDSVKDIFSSLDGDVADVDLPPLVAIVPDYTYDLSYDTCPLPGVPVVITVGPR
jgi:hypothetical protein